MNLRSIFIPLLFVSACCLGQDTAFAFKDLFLKAKLDVTARSVFMATVNDGSLKDDYAWAAGAGIGITTAPYHGFQAGISSFAVYNLLSSDLTRPDPATGMPNRYELGLFDVQNPGAKTNLIRIENLFLRYTLSGNTITVGKMKLNTPFLNPQDGRMNATMEEGAWLNINRSKTVQFNGGWFWAISPRSTTQWSSVAGSFGLYPVGVSEAGTKSNYTGNVQTSGVGLANAVIKVNDHFRVNLWDMVIDNVMNTAMIELNHESGGNRNYYQGLMFIHQDAIHDGGNADQSKTYMSRNGQSNIISGQVGLRTRRVNTSLNATYITDDGRYLSPREWGRDPFYTFMPREKNDGFGNVLAVSTRTSVGFADDRFRTGIGYGYFCLPDVTNTRLNKYGIPSYHQVNYDFTYSFPGFLRGFDIRCLIAWKIDQGNTYDNPKYHYNKVDMANFNLILDFRL